MFERAWAALDGKKKWIGLILATVMCWFGKISGEVWLASYTAFCAAETVKAVKGRGQSG